MKNQYFGDEHDFKKYMMLRCLTKNDSVRLLVAWYLTEDDKSENPVQKDGEKRTYLKETQSESKYYAADKQLFMWLQKHHEKRDVTVLEKNEILGKHTTFYNEKLTENAKRDEWFMGLCSLADKNDVNVVFADSDNGIRYNKNNSVKHIFIDEVKVLWNKGKSLILYQHAPYIDHEVFVYGTMMKLRKELQDEPFVATIKSSHVMYFLILKKEHIHYFNVLKENAKKWEGLLDMFDYVIE